MGAVLAARTAAMLVAPAMMRVTGLLSVPSFLVKTTWWVRAPFLRVLSESGTTLNEDIYTLNEKKIFMKNEKSFIL
jgi:hypothetical protein